MDAILPVGATDSENPAPRKPRVAVLFGGRSSEHAVSCATASSVLGAIDRDAYEVIPIGVTRTGRWVLAADDPDRWAITAGVLPEVKDGDGPGVIAPVQTTDSTLQVLEHGQVPRELGQVDVVFPLLHGPFGEDGTLQGLLELTDVRYVGAGVLASAASMDKAVMKVMLKGSGLPIGEYLVVRPGQWQHDPDGVRDDVEELGWPVFVKPARAGSSVGISKVDGPEGLDAAIAEALQHDRKLVIEASVVGREIECAVLQSSDGSVATSLPGEIEFVGGHDFYDFEAKYLDGTTKLSCPADLPADVLDRVRELSVRTFEAMNCEGLARVDFFVLADGSVVVNEINTMPGFTSSSMYPRMWAATGLDYPELIDRLIRTALARPTGLR
ncbi:D-alanine--D-alanine ligase [Kineosporia sp. J2-2]|uniref:D-alanine--D-alanine ligase n=1 Tax=Kineosporia corallincola TaxID=2835133 RepID=A0ABS5TFA7_9ACTN|nr:D-alanine--D-alanine ligase family protein [Kineosporia corallincola]MBT0769771.1 D-alanine--D-alanine ligase [Kineosporia corallincola]